MISFITASLVLLLTWLCGIPVYYFSRSSTLGKAGLSFILGSVAATLSVFISYWLFFHEFSLIQIIVTLTIVVLTEILLCVKFTTLPVNIVITENKHLFISVMAVILKKNIASLMELSILGIILFSLISNIFWPIHDWDALALYDYRAKFIVTAHTLSEDNPQFYFYQYPPFTSLLHAFTYFSFSSDAKVWYTLLFASFIACFYSLLRIHTSQLISLLGCFVLASSPIFFSHSIMAYTNLPFTILVSLGLLHITHWLQTKDLVYLFFGVLLIGSSQWVRVTEPFWMLGVCVLIVGTWKNSKQIPYILLSFILLILFRLPWSIFVLQLNLPRSDVDFSVVSAVLRYVAMSWDDLMVHVELVWRNYRSSVLTMYAPYLWLALIASLSLLWQKKYHLLLPGSLLLVTLTFIFFGTILFSQMFTGWLEITDSLTRMSMLVIPLSIYTVCISISGFQKTSQSP